MMPNTDTFSDQAVDNLAINSIHSELFQAAHWDNQGLAIRMMADDHGADEEGEDGALATEEAKPELKRPSMYKVIMLNDDYTPMEFVVQVLMEFFSMDQDKATRIMLAVHTEGRAVCGLYTRDVAETKAAQVNQFARDNEHPLLCDIEVAD